LTALRLRNLKTRLLKGGEPERLRVEPMTIGKFPIAREAEEPVREVSLRISQKLGDYLAGTSPKGNDSGSTAKCRGSW